MKPDIADLLRQSGGVIRRADHPQFAPHLDRLRQAGELVSPLPGILCMAGSADDFGVAALAGQTWAGPDAVLTGCGAARLTFWPDCPIDSLDFAIPRRYSARCGQWSQGFRRIPPELVIRRDRIAFTAPHLTAVDLAATERGGDAIDRALRSRQATLDQLWEVLRDLPGRRGNVARAAVLHDSRDEPWSEGERLLHRLLRERHITGWQTNAPIHIGPTTYFGDIVFQRHRLIVEFDGWAYHGDRAAFENDRRRRNELEAAGYRVLNVTWRQVTDEPDWVIDCICRALGDRNSLLEAG